MVESKYAVKTPKAAADAATPVVPSAFPGVLRLATFSLKPGGPQKVGLVQPDGRLLDIKAAARKLGVRLVFDPSRMISLIAAGEAALAQVRDLAARTPAQGPRLGDVTLLAPIPSLERNIYCVGWNYLDHFAEGAAIRERKVDLPEHPVFFSKAAHSINGPYSPVPFDPRVSTAIDWEVELAVIIGKAGKNIPEAQAMDHVFGFAVINDVSARDMQHKRHGGQWFKGKSLDGHAPLGPWIVTADGVDYNNLHLTTKVNGVVKQEATTKQMYFKVPRIIAELSLGLTLAPGDIIATGTPSGVGAARKPPEFLKPGDVVESEIAEFGQLRNVITPV